MSPSDRGERLQKVLARAGIASRRKAEELIKAGRVAVNRTVVTDMGVRVYPDRDTVTVDGRMIVLEDPIYILLHKPAGYVTTMADPQGRAIVTDLLPNIRQRVFPVGRLDLDSEGALLLTNDGRLGNHLLHPSNEVNKTYEATVRGVPSEAALKALSRGIELEGRRTWPATLRFLRKTGEGAVVEITIHEGRKRQVRKMFQAVGHRVLRLKRTAYGGLRLGGLPEGKYRVLGINDLKKIFSGKIPFTIKNIPA